MVSMLEPGLGVTSPLFLLYNRVACVTGAIKKGRGEEGEKAILVPRRRDVFGQRQGFEISPIPLAFIGT